MAYDGDNAGRLVGRSILADDADGLREVSSRIVQGHEIVTKWVQAHGGEIISGGGDEGTFTIPAEALEDIEQLRADYQHFTQLTLTIGVGKSLSEAGKSLLVGKFRGKDQVAQYDENVEQELEQAQSHLSDGSASPEEQKLGEAYLEQPAQEQAPGEMQESEDMIMAENSAPASDLCAETDGVGHEHGAEGSMMDDNCPMCQEDAAGAEGAADSELCDPNSELCADHGQDGISDPDCPMCQEAAGAPEGEAPKSELCEESNCDIPSVPGIDDQQSPQGDIVDAAEMPIGDEFEGGISRPDDYNESNTPGDMGLAEDEVPQEESPDLTSVLKDGLDSHADGIQREKVVAMVSQALEGFKANKKILEKAKEQAPQLYESTIAMLKAMIEMAKMLGLGSDESQGSEEPQSEGHPDPEAEAEQSAQQPQGEEEQANVGGGIGKLPSKNTTAHVARTPFPPGAVNAKGQQKIIDPKSGNTRWVDRKKGSVLSASGVPIRNPGQSDGAKN